MYKEKFFKLIHRNLIASCQALPGEPLFGDVVMAKMALACELGGAVAIRSNSVVDIRAIYQATHLPIIGLIKRNYEDSDVFITPTQTEVDALLDEPIACIALDATDRKRPHGNTLAELVQYIKAKAPEMVVMGDVATDSDATHAISAGVDMVSTTLSGYTSSSPKIEAPDMDLVEFLAREFTLPVIAEGRISTPEQARQLLNLGAWSVVVGGAITRPQQITRTFVKGMQHPIDGYCNGFTINSSTN
ncbi:N-acetylmannosamine-6-phosphate 2-epimerase [Alicyclobacillus sp. SO9]|uniref:N-acetylmannosamine-6-phosphate 2-epimerase n=1 Tax=Alicyclobacillus sp. SO9 TaxID=2665646 RepID=UPI0018E7404E|nr:N-acetylmannosamine-6-phosphate 2-epimerase [Alicyclobacillus sp. SO9]QQE78402.1 N-acetylmannosamine-6-phosphate 2-epimerase [Alicyclobacillus sp. SO9]